MNMVDIPGWIGSTLLVAAFWTRDDRTLNRILGTGLLAMALHLGMLGAWTACLTSLVCAGRCLGTLLLRSPVTVTLVACAATVAVSAATWAGWSSGLTLAAMLMTNVCLVTQRGIRLRLLLLPISLVWGASFVLVGSVPGMVTETLVALGNGWTAWRLFRHPAPVEHPAFIEAAASRAGARMRPLSGTRLRRKPSNGA